MTRSAFRAGAALVVAIFAAHAAAADEITVICSGGFSTALRELAPQFERVSGHKLNLGWGPSLGTTHDAIPMRFQRGESMDVLIMVGAALGELAKEGKVVEGSRVDLARSLIGMVVRKGAPKPDISSVEALERTLLAAKSIAYSDSASGVYISTEMFKRLGIEDQVKGKSRMIPAEPVARVVARGEAEIGFQQVSELLPVPGVDFVATLPPEVQKVTLFSAGIVAGSKVGEAGRALIRFLASADARAVVARTGLEPIVPAVRK
ncbi:MAG: ABC transporter substrate-binding protein [Deltaproteobacteria bacterium]|nr:MAG: ABC transporter substrate-binding protein [Deltaproteobacteria bacterium]